MHTQVMRTAAQKDDYPVETKAVHFSASPAYFLFNISIVHHFDTVETCHIWTPCKHMSAFTSLITLHAYARCKVIGCISLSLLLFVCWHKHASSLDPGHSKYPLARYTQQVLKALHFELAFIGTPTSTPRYLATLMYNIHV